MENTVCFDRKKIESTLTHRHQYVHSHQENILYISTQHKTIFDTFNKLCEINIPDTDLDMEAEVHKDCG